MLIDIEKRSQLVSNFRSLMDKRIGIEKQYSDKLYSLAYSSS